MLQLSGTGQVVIKRSSNKGLFSPVVITPPEDGTNGKEGLVIDIIAVGVLAVLAMAL